MAELKHQVVKEFQKFLLYQLMSALSNPSLHAHAICERTRNRLLLTARLFVNVPSESMRLDNTGQYLEKSQNVVHTF